MDLATFKRIAPDLDRDLADVFKKHGLKWTKRSATVGPTSINFRIVVTDANLKDAAGNQISAEVALWKAMAPVYGLPVDGIGKIVNFGVTQYMIEGMRQGRARKNVVIRRVSDDKTFVTTPDDIRRALA